MVQGIVIDQATGTWSNTNPATGDEISKVTCTSSEDLSKVIDSAASVQSKWASTSIPERIQCLRKGLQAVAAKQQEFAELITREMGKPLAESLAEVQEHTTDLVEGDFLQIIEEALQPQRHGKSLITRHAHGVVAILSPWNFPVGEIVLLLLPALASGNAVIVKPSEVVPETGKLFCKVFGQSLPEGVLQVVQGDGRVGKVLVEDSQINCICMTGSSATGKHILQSASQALKRVVLELGGKDPMMVLHDADVQKAAKDAVEYSLQNSGQVCCSIERIYVADSIYKEFQQSCTAYAKEYKVGNGMDPSTRVGPLVSDLQKTHVEAQVQDALEKGARLLYQSEIPSSTETRGNFYPVTVLADVAPNMDIYYQETFGPVVALTPFDGTEDQAVQLANDTPYGLGSAVYSQDIPKAQRIASRIQAGQVGINCYCLENMDTHCPWVGHKHSGYNYHSGTQGVHQFSLPKSIIFA